MRNYMNISSMLNNSSTGSFNLMDYSMIKSGSYGKLMKAYYAKPGKVNSSHNSVANSPVKDSVKDKFESAAASLDKSGVTKLKAEADALKKSAAELGSDKLWKMNNGEYDNAAITKAVKGFAEGYNKVIDQASKVKISSSDISNGIRWMESMTGTMSKALARVGITVGVDNKLSVNEDTLSKADMKSVKSLFEGSYSYGGQIEAKAQNLANADSTKIIYNNQASVYNTMQSMLSIGI